MFLRRSLNSLLNPLRYRMTRAPKTHGSAGYGDMPQLMQGLAAEEIQPSPLQLEAQEWRAWVDRARPIYERTNYYNGGRGHNFAEKSLEHYMAARLLRLTPGQVYLDIASANSPTPEIYESLYGCESWRQDMSYPAGVQGRCIGGDAAHMPLPDEFADAMAMHCSFEHFEGDSDSGFIREAARVLRPGGRLVILPLYLSTTYSIQTDPITWPGLHPPFSVPPEATLFFARGYGNRHGRFYSPTAFARRVCDHLDGLSLTLLHVENAGEADPSCYLRFVALFDKL